MFDLFSTKPIDVTNAVALKSETPKAVKATKEQVNILVQAGTTIKLPQSIIDLLGLANGNNAHITLFPIPGKKEKECLFITSLPSNLKEVYPKAKYTGRPVSADGKYSHILQHKLLGGQHSEWTLDVNAEDNSLIEVKGPNPNYLDYATSKAANPAEFGPNVGTEEAVSTWYHLVQVKDGAITRANLAKEVGADETAIAQGILNYAGEIVDNLEADDLPTQAELDENPFDEAPITAEQAAEYDAQATAWAEEQAEREQYLRDLAAEQEANAILANSPFDNEVGSNN